MGKPEEVLNPDDYKNYRNVRAVAILFVVLGSVLALAGVLMAVGFNPDGNKPGNRPGPQEELHPAVAVGIAVVGLAGAVGGIAALRGSRRWAPLVYVMAALYIFGFPIGTILSYVMLSGLSRYLESAERIRRAETGDA